MLRVANMNILLTSIGRRGLIVKYFIRELRKNGGGKVYTTDCDKTAPAIHHSDGYFLTPLIYDKNYIPTLIEICKDYQISGILSFIDPELEILAKNREKFNDLGVKILIPDEKYVQICYDKCVTQKFLDDNNIPTPITFLDVEDCISKIGSGKFEFPVMIKPVRGSASIGVQMVDNKEDLLFYSEKIKDYIIQEYFTGPEYGVDVLVDFKGTVISLFVKRKIRMRAGETDKAVSVKVPEVMEISTKIGELLGGPGPLDMDIFEKDGKYFVSEINPRFGGGYPFAYELGVNFMELMIKLLKNQEIKPEIGNYKENVYFAKYDHVVYFEG
jgi:carbamoyl-phosphate synthase large subunit